jgi:hypothetical protein
MPGGIVHVVLPIEHDGAKDGPSPMSADRNVLRTEEPRQGRTLGLPWQVDVTEPRPNRQVGLGNDRSTGIRCVSCQENPSRYPVRPE